MKRCIAAVLLVLSLEALAAGRLSAAVADDHVDTIRLPSHGLADEAATVGAEKKRPWKCCDSTWCTRSIPPACRCMDAVEQCDEACQRCEASQSDPSKHICIDRYRGWPGPNCTNPDADDVSSGPGVSGHQETVAVAITEEPRPWRCCNRPLCTRSNPPTCRCLDNVDRCAPACKRCVVSIFDPTEHSCDDQHQGDPGPRCTVADRNGDISRGVTSRPHAGVAEKTVVGDEKSALDGEEMAVSEEMSVIVDGEKPRPWKCCDQTLCTRSAPPTCFCHDKVKKCAKTCKNCLKDESGSSLRMCGDPYFGWPGPKCHKV